MFSVSSWLNTWLCAWKGPTVCTHTCTHIGTLTSVYILQPNCCCSPQPLHHMLLAESAFILCHFVLLLFLCLFSPFPSIVALKIILHTNVRFQASYVVVAVVQSLSCVQLFGTPWTAAHQASLSFTISQSLLKLMPFELISPSWDLPTYRKSIQYNHTACLLERKESSESFQ